MPSAKLDTSTFLQELLETTQSDCAILRKCSVDSPDQLEKQGCVWANQSLEREFDVPLFKDTASFDGRDPRVSWGTKSRRIEGETWGCDLANLEERERKFVDWVQHKAWFPVYLGDVPHVVALLRGNGSGYAYKDVVANWYDGQSLAFSDVDPASEFAKCWQKIDDSLAWIRGLRCERKWLAAFCYAMCSGYGLGWNRVLLFRAEGEESLRCEIAVGEFDADSWRHATENLQEASFAAELELAMDEAAWMGDSLHRILADRVIAFDPNQMVATDNFGVLEPAPTDFADALDKVIFEQSNAGKFQTFANSDTPLMTLSFSQGERRFVAAFQMTYSANARKEERETLTACWTAYFGSLLGIWQPFQEGR